MPARSAEVADGDSGSTYDLPFVTKYLNKWSFTRFIPICPLFMASNSKDEAPTGQNEHDKSATHFDSFDHLYMPENPSTGVQKITAL